MPDGNKNKMDRILSEESDRSNSSSSFSRQMTNDEEEEGEGEEMEEGEENVIPEEEEEVPEVKEKEPGKFMLDFDDRADEHKKFLQEFFQKEPCLYTHRVFKFAADVYHTVKEQRRLNAEKAASGMTGKALTMELPNIEFRDSNEKRLSFGLVFSTLKYQQFLEDMLTDCHFFAQYPEYKEQHALVMVILCDFKLRKFQMRTSLPGEDLDSDLTEIEQMLYGCKTKLNAALARSRIKACVISIDHLLPESVRKNDKLGANMSIFCWVNLIKTNVDEVITYLEEQDFIQVEHEEDLMGKTYYLDVHCFDLIGFSADQREYLEESDLTMNGHIVIQDKSSCVGPQSVRNLINEGDDVMHVNLGSGLATAHLASLTNGSDTVIYAFGISSDRHRKSVEQKLDKLGAKSRVKLLTENFLDIEHNDDRLKHIKVALIMADCSKSAVANPVNFIVSEGEDMSILKDLSIGALDDTKITHLAAEHNSILTYATRYMSILKDLSIGQLNDTLIAELVTKHYAMLRLALRFPRVQAVVYCTRSLIEAENEGVVNKVIEYINLMYQKKTPFRVSPPVISLTKENIEEENPVVGKFLRYMPSNIMSGCFISTITREADDPKEAAKDILARAAARGIITGVPTKADKKKKKGAKKKNKAKKKVSLTNFFFRF